MLRKLIFGAKNERFMPETKDSLQLSLFENNNLPEENEPKTEEISYQRKKKNKPNKREKLPENLERVTEVIEPDELPEEHRKIGELVTEILEYKPGELYVRQIVRPKYAVKVFNNETNTEEETIINAELPSLPFPKSNAGASLAAHIITQKFVYHIPVFRQLKIFKNQGIKLPESSVNDWIARAGDLLEILYNVLKQRVLAGTYLQADESPMPVQSKDKIGATHKGYMWIYHSPPERLLFFDYQKSRSGESTRETLKNFKGILQTDGYAAYNSLGNSDKVTLAACWAHARRKFFDSNKTYPKESSRVLKLISRLYNVERFASENSLSEESILWYRKNVSAPIIAELEEYLISNKDVFVPKSNMGKAIGYALSLMPRLKVYLDDARVRIDNNLIENSVRPLALGRKNYLFAGSHEAAKRVAIFYSFFGTCHLRGTDPYNWLKTTLEKIQDQNIQNLKELLP